VISISAAYSKDFFRRQYIPQEFANAALAGQSRDNHLIKRDFTSRDLLVSAMCRLGSACPEREAPQKQLTCRSGGSPLSKAQVPFDFRAKEALKGPAALYKRGFIPVLPPGNKFNEMMAVGIVSPR
jgi:hypothetical protein